MLLMNIAVLALVFHEHIGEVEVSLAQRIVDRLDVVEAVRVHVAAALAQGVNHLWVVRAHRQHQWRVAVVVLRLQVCAVVQ